MYRVDKLLALARFISDVPGAEPSSEKNIYTSLRDVARAAMALAGANRIERYAIGNIERFAVERARSASKRWNRLRASWASTTHAQEDGRDFSTEDLATLFRTCFERCNKLIEAARVSTLGKQEAFQYQICAVLVLNSLIVPQRTSLFSSLSVGDNLIYTGESGGTIKWKYSAFEDQVGDKKNMKNATDYR